LQQAKTQADAELADSRQRLAAFAGRLQQAVEEERTGIARDIHDSIGGALAALRFDLAWLARQPGDVVPEMVRTRLQSAQQTLAQAVEASQEIMRNLRPAVLDQGLGAALEWLAQSFTQRTQVPVQQRIALADMPAISTQQALTAYRMAQEALTNIQKHAGATQVWLEASDSHGLLTVEVRDNGLGIRATPAATAGHGHGLAGLRERAALAGGWLDVGSASGQGTSLTLSMPLAGHPEPEATT
jgi:signal transduction histidine kinase